MLRAEREAVRVGRSLLTLDTCAGDAGEVLYRDLGWNFVGCIPGYALKADRAPCDTLFFWKQPQSEGSPSDAVLSRRDP
jgi:hypothetical protein